MKTISTSILSVVFLCLTVNMAYANDDVWWQLVCPPDVTVNCDDELWDLSIYGDAYIDTYGGHQSAGTPTVNYYLNSCGSGYIKRTWMAEDPYWNWVSCTQYIHVGGGGSFGYNNIEWPEDKTVYGCNPDTHPDVTGYPWYDYVECTMIGVSYKDMLFTVNDGCKKIMRTWTLMDWCSSSSTYYNKWTHRQFIKIINDEVPEFDCIADITVTANNCKNAYVDADPLHVDPSMCGGHFTIKNNSPYATQGGANISGTYPVGKHKVAITVNFGCGMKKTCWVNVHVINNKPPAPICLSQVNIALMGIDTDKDGVNDQGMVDIWAKDLNWKSYSDCGFYPLTYSFAADSIVMSRRFTCDELGLNDVKMYVHDSKGGVSYCQVKIDVQNNGAKITPCERKVVEDTTHQSRLYVSGKIVDKDDKGIAESMMYLYDETSSLQYITTYDTTVTMRKDSFINYSGAVLYFFETDTVIVSRVDTVLTERKEYTRISDVEGFYMFEDGVSDSSRYTLNAGNLSFPVKNVDKADLDALTEYILGTRTFTSEREYLAADINEDKVIDLSDLSLLIKFIKGEIETFDKDWITYLETEEYKTEPKLVLEKLYTELEVELKGEPVEGIVFKAVQKGDITDKVAAIPNGNVEIRSAEEYVDDYTSSIVVLAYPNPFHREIMFDLASNTEGDGLIRILSIDGTELLAENITINKGSTTLKINMGDIPNRMVVYQVIVGDNTYSGKLLSIK